jgi:RNA polymerase sigma factor (sigma-70 family)
MDSRTPDDQAVRERAAAGLSRLERDVLILSARMALRNEEIAARLGISAGRVERVLARALRKFDRALGKLRS